MRRRWLVFVAVALVTAAASSGEAAAGDRHRGFSRGTQQAIDRIVADAMAQGPIPGVVVGVWVGGRRYVQGYGTANVATGKPMTTDLHLRIASVSKTFTATAILRLVDQGKLGLDDKLSTYVRGIDFGNRITIRQLLNMTAGVYSFTDDPAFLASFDANPLLPFTPQDALDIVRRNEPRFEPGTDWSYSDSNYVLLGLILEKVTGRSAGDVIRREVLRPLGLADTSFPTTPAIPVPRSRGYVVFEPGDPLRDVTAVNPDVPWTAGNMISTVDDLGVYAKAIATGTLLSRATQKQRLQLVETELSPSLRTGYGLGLFGVQGFLGHTGAILGFSTMMFHLPAEDATIVVIGNQATNFSEPTFPIFYGIAKQLFPNRFPA